MADCVYPDFQNEKIRPLATKKPYLLFQTHLSLVIESGNPGIIDACPFQ